MYILIYHSLCPIFAIFITKWSEIFIYLIIILGNPLGSPEFLIGILEDLTFWYEKQMTLIAGHGNSTTSRILARLGQQHPKAHDYTSLRYYEKATNFCEISTIDLSYVVTVKFFTKFHGLLRIYDLYQIALITKHPAHWIQTPIPKKKS